MIIRVRRKRLFGAFAVLAVTVFCILIVKNFATAEKANEKSYVKWVEFNASLSALQDTMQLDIDTYDNLYHISWIDSLSYLACKNGNNWKSYKKAQLDKMIFELGDCYTVEDLIGENKYFDYYRETFSAILGGILGEYEKQAPDGNGGITVKKGYGLVAYGPIAEGFYYSHYRDFGASRSFGYRRSHLGNDLLGNVGTPIVAVEGGIVECYGWNKYGGWRLGIRSFDGKRSYYYAHLRKGSPYHADIKQGTVVKAGQVIGYMGMTGYSDTPDVNGMSVPHLHFGMQLIFDESQKEGNNQIWLDMYNLVELLEKNRATVIKKEGSQDYFRKYDIILSDYPDKLKRFY